MLMCSSSGGGKAKREDVAQNFFLQFQKIKINLNIFYKFINKNLLIYCLSYFLFFIQNEMFALLK
jgi:hypothetical protein